jgi:outer membrane receptor protein involved in Fe transport
VVHDDFTNIATARVEGFDFNVRWVRDIGPGNLRVNLLLTQYLHQQQKLFSTDPFTDFNGLPASPAYTANLDATYTYHGWKVRYGLEWVAPTNAYAYEFGDGATAADAWIFAPNILYDLDTESYFLHSLSLQYRSTHGWQLTIGVNNLTDENPPFFASVDGVSFPRAGNALIYSGYDYRGREYFVNVTRSF